MDNSTEMGEQPTENSNNGNDDTDLGSYTSAGNSIDMEELDVASDAARGPEAPETQVVPHTTGTSVGEVH